MARTLPVRTVSALVAAAAVAPATALAQGSPPGPLPDEAAIYQYREALPTGGGPVAPGPGTTRATPLLTSSQAALQADGGRDARLLERVATSSDFGAPQGPLRRPDPEARPAAAPELPPPSLSRSVEAAAGALADVPARLVLALALILGLTAAFAVAARRDARDPA
jgi:hypothetical protein